MPLWEKRTNFFVLAVLVLFHLILISVQVPLHSDRKLFERAAFFVFSPVQRAAVWAFRGVGALWTGYFDLRGVRKENQKLKRDLFFLNQEKWFLEDRLLFFRSEAQLRDSLASFRQSLVVARVIGADAGNYFRSLILDRGSLEGVGKDRAVCDRFGNLVGRTIEPVSLTTTMVQLITDEESGVSVISGKDKIVGILSGTSGGQCTLKYITATKGGEEGEELLTTGFDKIYPAGIRVGRIISAKATASIFKEIRVQPYFSFAALEAVAILPKVGGGNE
jgi:rod shape-determining protein MreC